MRTGLGLSLRLWSLKTETGPDFQSLEKPEPEEMHTSGAGKVYFTIPPHSIWNPYGMDIFHGFHMDSIWNMF